MREQRKLQDSKDGLMSSPLAVVGHNPSRSLRRQGGAVLVGPTMMQSVQTKPHCATAKRLGD